jgi:hypothetical protein
MEYRADDNIMCLEYYSQVLSGSLAPLSFMVQDAYQTLRS